VGCPQSGVVGGISDMLLLH
jgi:hypothetical protein